MPRFSGLFTTPTTSIIGADGAARAARRGRGAGKAVLASVLTGAFLLSGQPMAGAQDDPGTGHAEQTQSSSLPAFYENPARGLTELVHDTKAEADRVAAEQAAAEAPDFVKPAEGTFTSGFGSRWGTTHYGVDIANPIGTPVVAATDGTVINAGPATGFGQWVRVQAPDGTITVYGHVDTFTAEVGQEVTAGQQIATIGNRGQSTGPHLHFEVAVNGQKIDPQPWLAERGITLQ
ncbi:murein DD-endopeptidase MepM/ murein hydrolase activator NlpD [Actinoalloteichus hoggarensis]|uniref:Murein DD-endopeptidase MepM n=1 Tax=Actinoalloteichus hoggarensis TaxID=1470176 RepID=A0A221W2H6_9PSEU|nr:M23 family metallopeptidase [Actinoalloteichus hoggarensis]ASO19927.1 Murein DD-endopeptidase MepM [Actinoalloteichus hoggarensis]MBB5919363.1 murein DD-endopeptidase MepM/ murein hydrolase activator NlpD [Actinoalloteichus hoggarensis]